TLADTTAFNSTGAGGNPFTSVLLVQTKDTAKADNFITKVNAGLPALAQMTPTQDSNGLYSLSVPGTDTANYGRLKNTFVLSLGKDSTSIVNALNGDGVLSSDPAWKEAAKLAPPAFQHFWYVNLMRINALLQPLVNRSPSQSDKQMFAVLGLFKSVVMY